MSPRSLHIKRTHCLRLGAPVCSLCLGGSFYGNVCISSQDLSVHRDLTPWRVPHTRPRLSWFLVDMVLRRESF